MEEAYKHEMETRDTVDQVFRLCFLYDLKDTLDAAEDGADENRLLPAMNKIWPFLVSCIRNKNPVVRVFGYSLIKVDRCPFMNNTYQEFSEW